jgi:hypothetical protein
MIIEIADLSQIPTASDLQLAELYELGLRVDQFAHAATDLIEALNRVSEVTEISDIASNVSCEIAATATQLEPLMDAVRRAIKNNGA